MYRNTIIPQTAPNMPPRVPPPSHRHGGPSGPWPFLDIDDEVDPDRIADPNSHLPLSATPCSHLQTTIPHQDFCWCKYPQALYPNWTRRQQKKSRIARVIDRDKDGRGNSTGESTLHYLDVMEDGMFVNAGERDVVDRTLDPVWVAIQQGRPPNVRVRALFVEGLSGPVLQMLGTRYNVEPFFFSSTIGWIPSRFQSHVVPGKSDHITITLSFIRPIQNPTTVPPSPNPSFISTTGLNLDPNTSTQWNKTPDLVIDTQAPLPLRSSNLLLLSDLLAVHMVRSRSSTIISLHPNAGSSHRATTAQSMHTRVHLTGRSVYWSNIFKDTEDPTFVLLSHLWYALYAWDETLEALYNHICFLESQVMVTNDIQMTQELHVVRAHLLHYESLLQDFKKSVTFVAETPNPRMEARPKKKTNFKMQHQSQRSSSGGTADAPGSPRSPGPRSVNETRVGVKPEEELEDYDANEGHIERHDEEQEAFDDEAEAEEEEEFEKMRKRSAMMMQRECQNLLLEIERLERSRKMQEKRLKNVMDLEFSSVNIEDSKRMQKLTEAAVKDSAAMKQIAYLTMAFLPASFVAAVFGMNVTEINPDAATDLPHYVAVAIPLTAITIWIIVAYQIQITEPRMRTLDTLGEKDGGGHEVQEQQQQQEIDASQFSYLGFGLGGMAGGGGGGGGGNRDMMVRKLNIWNRLWWPVILFSSVFERRKRRRERMESLRRARAGAQTRIETFQNQMGL